MTPQTRKDLKDLATTCRKLSQKKGKITKTDLKGIVAIIFSIAQSGDVELRIPNSYISIIRGITANWLAK